MSVISQNGSGGSLVGLIQLSWMLSIN